MCWRRLTCMARDGYFGKCSEPADRCECDDWNPAISANKPDSARQSEFASLISQIADLPRGPYRPRERRVTLPMTVLRHFDCVLAPTKKKGLGDL